MKEEVYVKVYIGNITSLKDKDCFQKAYESVSEYRQNKIDSIRFPDDKKRSLCAGLLLQKALADIKIDEKQVEYVLKDNGKPYIKGVKDFHFNLSHSGDYSVCTVSNKIVGCDIELIKNIDFKLADRFFNQKEAELIKNQQTNEQKLDLFFRIWTLKESFIKATGKGLSEKLQSFYFDFISDDFENAVLVLEKSLSFSKNQKNNEHFSYEQFSFKQIPLDDNYKLSVCCSSKIDKIDIVSTKDFHYI